MHACFYAKLISRNIINMTVSNTTVTTVKMNTGNSKNY